MALGANLFSRTPTAIGGPRISDPLPRHCERKASRRESGRRDHKRGRCGAVETRAISIEAVTTTPAAVMASECIALTTSIDRQLRPIAFLCSPNWPGRSVRIQFLKGEHLCRDQNWKLRT